MLKYGSAILTLAFSPSLLLCQDPIFEEPAIHCESTGCNYNAFELAPPPAGLVRVIAFHPASTDGSCVCDYEEHTCDVEKDEDSEFIKCFVQMTVTIVAVPAGVTNTDVILSQSTVGNPAYRYTNPVGCSPLAALPINVGIPVVYECENDTDDAVNGFPWLCSISGYTAFPCVGEPSFTYHCWPGCFPCGLYDEDC